MVKLSHALLQAEIMWQFFSIWEEIIFPDPIQKLLLKIKIAIPLIFIFTFKIKIRLEKHFWRYIDV